MLRKWIRNLAILSIFVSFRWSSLFSNRFGSCFCCSHVDCIFCIQDLFQILNLNCFYINIVKTKNSISCSLGWSAWALIDFTLLTSEGFGWFLHQLLLVLIKSRASFYLFFIDLLPLFLLQIIYDCKSKGLVLVEILALVKSMVWTRCSH